MFPTLNALRYGYSSLYIIIPPTYSNAFPFLVIGCKGGPPSGEQRPCTIAEAIASWKDADDLNFKPLIGDLGQGDDIDIDPAMANRILPLEVSSQEVFLS